VADLKSAIKSASSMAEITFRIKMTLKKDKLEISCEDNGNVVNGDVEATFTESEPLDVVCNFRLLLEILEKINSSMVRFQLADGNTPILIRSVEDESVKYVFMPFVS
jgi:DNA polymerase III sliding clamp (beta) subunit (PCNA family)